MMDQGKYFGRLTSAAAEVNQNNKPYLSLVWSVTHELQNGDWAPLPMPATRRTTIWVTEGVWNSPQAVEILERNLKALGFNGDFGDPKFDARLSEAGAELVCEHEANAGKTYEKWFPAAWQATRTDGATIDTATARKLNALLRAKTSIAKPTGPATPPPAPAAPTPPPAEEPRSGDDIPF